MSAFSLPVTRVAAIFLKHRRLSIDSHIGPSGQRHTWQMRLWRFVFQNFSRHSALFHPVFGSFHILSGGGRIWLWHLLRNILFFFLVCTLKCTLMSLVNWDDPVVGSWLANTDLSYCDVTAAWHQKRQQHEIKRDGSLTSKARFCQDRLDFAHLSPKWPQYCCSVMGLTPNARLCSLHRDYPANVVGLTSKQKISEK